MDREYVFCPIKVCSFTNISLWGYCIDDFSILFVQEEGISLLTIIKGTYKYRRSRKLDSVADFLPPSRAEFKYAFDQVVG